MLGLVRLPARLAGRLAGRLLAPLFRWLVGKRCVLLLLAVLQAIFRGAEGHLVPVVKQRPKKRSLLDIGKGAVRDASHEVAWSAAETVLWFVRTALEFLGICLPDGKYNAGTSGGTGGTGGTGGETPRVDQSEDVASDEALTSPVMKIASKDSVQVYDIDSDTEGSAEVEAEDRLNLEKFRTAASVKQVERSESKIQDLHRQVHEYESTVEHLQNQVKSLTAQLLARARDGVGAGRLSTGSRRGEADLGCSGGSIGSIGSEARSEASGAGAYTPAGVHTPQGVSPAAQVALLAELTTKLRNRRDSDASSVSAGSPSKLRPLRRSESDSSPLTKDPGAEYLKVLRASPRSPQVQRYM
jgi:uncharacterized coiled-coil protein SlyX